ncbi:MAG: endonuclease [Paludibacteraceae bacterium]|nr:endonuclease [Paludibacteraceae bacterium]
MRNIRLLKTVTLLTLQLVLLTCCTKTALADDKTNLIDSVVEDEAIDKSLNTRRIVSYNVENLFDTQDDPNTRDDDFTPYGQNHWTRERYERKQQRIAKVIASIGEGNPPMLVALMEIENDYVLKGLTEYSPLKNLKYKYIHRESPDPRGIDVALLYQPKEFEPIKTDFIKIDGKLRTREILYAQGRLKNNAIINVFVVHFPSRRGGQESSEWKRMKAAEALRKQIDKLFEENPKANIIIMGDFNDYPDNISVKDVLKATKPGKTVKSDALYNLFAKTQEEGKEGSHKFGKEWGMLDQIIVSGSLLDRNASLHATKNSGNIFKRDYLLIESNQGLKPNRTYNGFKYNESGYSDHLPVFFDIVEK